MTLTLLGTPRPPLELQVISSLKPRINLSASTKKIYDNLSKGYEGELKLFKLLEKELFAECFVLYDLHIECNQTQFQIDSLLIFENTICMIEVKNYYGDFYVKEDKWYAVATTNEIRNPLSQLKRSEFLLRQLIQKLNHNYVIESYLIFVNEEFFLYQAPYEPFFVFPNQLQRFIKKLNSKSGNITRKHNKLAEQLAMLHIPISSNQNSIEYKYSELNKGIVCRLCGNFLHILNKAWLQCNNCGQEEKDEDALIRSVKEYNLLFPSRKITISAIYDWCNMIFSKKKIRRILTKKMDYVKNGRYSYYKFKS